MAITGHMLMASGSRAQTLEQTKVDLELKHETLKAAFGKIEGQTDFRFAYRPEQIRSHRVDLVEGSYTVDEALRLLLTGTELQYKLINNNILITPVAKVTPTAVAVQKKDGTVNGQVKDKNGDGLAGVSVTIKGTTTGTVTDGGGRFKLNVPASSTTLVFSYLGFKTREIMLTERLDIDVVLEEDLGKLDEVVVIGYGTTTQRNSTGTVSSISSKDIADQPINDPLSALQGRIPGLVVNNNNGYAGSDFTVRLRGVNSISSGSDPLYIVDGVPFISKPINQFTGANGNQSPLSGINPNDIERIDVLKDADATAIYGSRGANGVILITTKKGKAGNSNVDLTIYSGISKVSRKVKMLNTQQYLEMRREAFANDNIIPTVDNAPDLLLWDQNLDNDWQKKLIGNTAHLTQAQGSVSGGNEFTRFLVSGTYRRESTVLPTDLAYKRGAAHVSIDHSSTDRKFNINALVTYAADDNNTLPTDLTQYYNLSPNYPVYDGAGKYYWYSGEQNPLAYLERTYQSNNRNLVSNITTRYTILNGLNVKANFGYNQMSLKQVTTLPKLGFNPATYSASSAIYGNNDVSSYIVEPQVDYVKQLGKSTLQALVGGTWQQSISQGQRITGSTYASDAQLENIKAAAQLVVNSYNYTKYRYTSVFGRLTYNWDEKYIINGTFRRDGSSRFGPNKRFGNFGAVGAAWLFSNEAFVRSALPWLSFGKLRGSYGTVGNDQIGDYQYFDSFSSSTYPYGGLSGLYPSRFPNLNYGWEVNKKLEAAIEMGFLNDRIVLNTNFYRNRSGNQLIGYTLSSQSGFTSYQANLPALVENKGWEFLLNTVNIRGKDLNWNTSLNLTIAKNTLLAYPNLANTGDANTYVIGQPLRITKGYHFTGVDPQTGLSTVQDIDGNNTISNPNDFTVIGKLLPTLYGGMQNNLTFKKWSLDVLLQYVKQRGPGLNYGYLTTPYGSLKNKDISALDRWRKPGDVTNIPRASSSSANAGFSSYNNLYRLSDAEWSDASYVKLKNVSIRYDLSELLKRWKLRNCSIYFQGQNLLTFTKYKGMDPETLESSLLNQGPVLPTLRTYIVGLQFGF